MTFQIYFAMVHLVPTGCYLTNQTVCKQLGGMFLLARSLLAHIDLQPSYLGVFFLTLSRVLWVNFSSSLGVHVLLYNQTNAGIRYSCIFPFVLETTVLLLKCSFVQFYHQWNQIKDAKSHKTLTTLSKWLGLRPLPPLACWLLLSVGSI